MSHRVKSAFKNSIQQQTQGNLARAALEHAITQFVDLYLTPQGDAERRLGGIVESTDLPTSGLAFPPFTIASVAPDATTGTSIRSGGFKQINDQINSLQHTLAALTGQVRTKITEWDISLYLQQGLIDDEVAAITARVRRNLQARRIKAKALGIPAPPPDDGYYAIGHFYSLLFHILKENPAGYRQPRQAAIYGMLNAALSSWKFQSWDPRFDPELASWTPPGTSQFKPLQALAPLFSFWGNTWAPPLPPDPPANPYPKGFSTSLGEDKDDAYWAEQVKTYWGEGNYTPEFWRLFYTSPHGLPSSDDKRVFESKLDNPRENGQPASNSENAIGLNVNPYGISATDASPIFSGGPYGSTAFPRALGVFFQSGFDHPKMPLSESSPISQSYVSTDPVREYTQLTNDWYSERPILSPANYVIPTVWVRDGAYTGHNQALSPILVNIWSVIDALTKARAPHYGQDTNADVPALTESTTFIRKSGYWPDLVLRTVNTVNSSEQLGLTGGSLILEPLGDASGLLSQLAAGEQAPLIIVTQDRKYVMETLVTKGVITTYIPGETHHFLWWSWTTSTAVEKPCLLIDPYLGISLLPVLLDDDHQNQISQAQLIPPVYFFSKPGIVFQGAYFHIPGRTLSPNSSVIRDGWNTLSPAIPQNQGIALARSRLTYLWTSDPNKFPTLMAPFRGLLTSLYSTLLPFYTQIGATLAPLQQNLSLEAFQLIFTPGQVLSETVLGTMADVRAYFLNADGTKLSPEFLDTKTVIAALTSIFLDGPPVAGDPVANMGLLTLVKYLAGLEDKAVPRNQNKTMTLDQRFTKEAYDRFSLLYFTNLAKFTTNTVAMRKVYKFFDFYLRILYERRFILLKQRLNITDGSLLQVARLESGIGVIQEAVKKSTTPVLAQAALEDLEIKFQVTDQTQAMKALAFSNGITLPDERLLIVYAAVEYDEKQNIIRPATGLYHLVSLEYAQDNKGVIADVAFPLTFVAGNSPAIVNGIVTGVDGAQYAKVAGRDDMTLQEKICFASVVENLWEIVIPTASIPLRKNFNTGLHLMMMPPEKTTLDVDALLGGGRVSPVHEEPTGRAIPLAPWVSAPASTKTGGGVA